MSTKGRKFICEQDHRNFRRQVPILSLIILLRSLLSTFQSVIASTIIQEAWDTSQSSSTYHHHCQQTSPSHILEYFLYWKFSTISSLFPRVNHCQLNGNPPNLFHNRLYGNTPR